LTTPTPSDNYNFTAVFWIAASAEDNRTGIDEATIQPDAFFLDE
jgi:hypothetical protein